MNEISKYIPLDKSWMNRMGVLDITHKYYDIIPFLEKQKNLGDDLKSLYRASTAWKKGEKQIYVGESGTLYRFLRFASWAMGLEKEFVVDKTLTKRVEKMCNNPEIVDWPLEELLKLDNGTSQWASASVLTGRNMALKGEIKNFPSKLQLTYEAREHWNVRRFNNECWDPRYDETIEKQASAYVDLLRYGKLDFVSDNNAENYCFMRIFGLIRADEGERRWPQLRKHETDRIDEMERIIELINKGAVVDTPDHRGAPAYAMIQLLRNKEIKLKDKSVVNKSWPQFWDFLDYCNKVYKGGISPK